MTSLVAALLLSMLVVAPPVMAAPSAPTVDAEHLQTGSTGDVVLAWLPVAGATSYKVEVASSSTFSSPLLYSVSSTVALRSTPNVVLPSGTIHWRVAAFDSSGQSEWTTSSFERATLDGPTLISPGVGGIETLDYPDEAPVLSWSPFPGARDYKVEWSSDSSFPASTSFSQTTPATSFAIPDLLSRGITWHWRVTANLVTTPLTSAPSPNGKFVIAWPGSRPTLSSPAHDPSGATPVTDIDLAWSPVPGAKTYKVYAATDSEFTAQVPGTPVEVKGTRYSPPRSWANAAYYWKVTATDPAGNEGPASEVAQFSRSWGPTSEPQMSATEQIAAPETVDPVPGATVPMDDFRLEWTAVPRASVYEVWITPETSNFFSDQSKVLKCYTPHTSLTHLSAWQPLSAGTFIKFLSGSSSSRTACNGKLGGGTNWPIDATYRWRVRALDLSAADTGSQQNPGNVDALARFIRSDWSDHATAGNPAAVTVTSAHPVTAPGLAPTLVSPADCTNPATCASLPDTPELVWTPAADATAGYVVQIAQDAAFSNMVAEFHTYSARYRMDGGLLDNSANQAYYWRVLGCESFSRFDSKSCLSEGLANKRAFRKVGEAPVDPAASVQGDQVTFSWQEHLLTAAAGGGTRGYEVQVSPDETFSSAVWTTKVDQPFATTSDELLPDRTYYWRVRALDGVAAVLPWTTGQTFTKSAPKPTQHPAASGPVAPTLSWDAVPGSRSYQLEVYDGDNLSGSGSLKVSKTGLLNPSFAPTTVLPPGIYSWRVNRLDPEGNALPWTVVPGGDVPTFEIRSTGVTPVSPVDGAALSPAERLLTWSAVSGAARYRVQTSASASFSTTVESVDTVQTRFAPGSDSYLPGTTYYWRALPLNASGNVLSSANGVRTFSVMSNPGAPSATATTSGTTLTVSWTPGSTGGTPVTGFVVRYRKFGTSAWSEVSKSSSAMSHVESGLDVSTKYEAQVAAVNAIGTGPFSSIVSATTATVPSAPGTPRITAGTGQLTVSWSAPNSGGSQITGYVVRWMPTGSGTPSQLTVSGTSTILTGLSPGVAYTVDVAATNLIGTGLFSTPAQGTPTGSSTPATTPPPGGSSGSSTGTSLTITGGKTILYGGSATLSGTLKASSGAAVGSKSVTVQFRPVGTTAWATAGSATTNSSGSWSADVKPTVNREYRAVFAGAAPHQPSTSSAIKVLVAPKVTTKLSAKKVKLGKKVVFSGAIKPVHKASKVQLQRLQGKKWVTKKAVNTSSTSTYRFVWKTDSKTDFYWRVLIAAHGDHVKSYSAARKLTVQ